MAVGECGLDYFYEHSPRDVQRDVFAAQIALAHAHDLALVIHTRDAWDDTFDVLAAEGTPERTIFHCFTGGPPEARRCLDLGVLLSFSGIVTFGLPCCGMRRGHHSSRREVWTDAGHRHEQRQHPSSCGLIHLEHCRSRTAKSTATPSLISGRP